MMIHSRKRIGMILLAGVLVFVSVTTLAGPVRRVLSTSGDAQYYDPSQNEVYPFVKGAIIPEDSVLCLEEEAQVDLDISGDAKVIFRLVGPAVWAVDPRYFQPDAAERFRDSARQLGEQLVISPVVTGKLKQQSVKVTEGEVKVTTLFRDDEGAETELYSIAVKAGERAVVSPCGVVEIEPFELGATTQDTEAEAEEALEDTTIVVIDPPPPPPDPDPDPVSD